MTRGIVLDFQEELAMVVVYFLRPQRAVIVHREQVSTIDLLDKKQNIYIDSNYRLDIRL